VLSFCRQLCQILPQVFQQKDGHILEINKKSQLSQYTQKGIKQKAGDRNSSNTLKQHISTIPEEETEVYDIN